MQWFIFAFLAAIFSGMAIIVEKKSLLKEHALEVCTLIAIFNFLLMVFFIKYINLHLSLEIYLLIYVASVIGTFAFWYVDKGVRHLDISIASPLFSFSPVAVAILALIILKETLTGQQISGIALLIIGSYILQTGKKQKTFLEPFKKMLKTKAIKHIFIGLFLFAIGALFDRYLLNPANGFNINVFTYIFLLQLFIMINFIILINLLHDGFRGIKDCFNKVGKWVFLVAIFIVARRLFYASAVSMQEVSLVYPIYRTSALFATVIGGELFHEKGLFLKTISCIIMLIGAYLIITV